MTDGRPLPRPEDHDVRLLVARNVARYELGDESWADLIVGAYLNPAEADVPDDDPPC